MSWQLTKGEKIFNVLNLILLGLIGLIALYPFIYTVSLSLSSAAEANRVSLHLWPREVSLTAYKMVLAKPEIRNSFLNSVLRTVLGTALTLLSTAVVAYPLARKEMPHRGLVTFGILFTMIFNGGIVPLYMLVNGLGLMNCIWALVLPSMLTAFNIIIVKNFFQAIPESFAESARIEGASELRILFSIYIPLSKPVLATVALWTAIFHWNEWFHAMLFITDDAKQVIQTFLQRIVIEYGTEMVDTGLVTTDPTQFTPETIKAATVVITIVPIILIYPFLQKYFTKGIMLGGIKE